MITPLNRIIFCILSLSILASNSARGKEPSVEDLAGKLGSADEQVRIDAARQLGWLGPAAAPAVPALKALLRDDSPMVRAYAAGSLGRIGDAAKPAVPDLVRSIADPAPAVRRKSIESLERLRPDPALTVRAFVRLMEDPEPSVRLRALSALVEHGETAVPVLIELLEKDQAAYWACLVLNEIGPDAKAAVPALTQRVSDPRAEVRREAILALTEIGEAAAPVLDAITSAMDDEADQIVATYALGRLGQIPPEAESRIRENAHSPDPLLRTVSVWTLARLYPADETLRKGAFRQLVELLKSEDPQVRATAARALVALDPSPNLLAPMLDEALRDADEETMRYAVDAVARLGSVMVPQLIDALRFESLRPRVVFLLGEIGPDAKAAVEALVELIKSPDRRTREETLLALAKIGPAASSAVPALTKALYQPEGTSRYGAAYALGRIGPPAESAIQALLSATRNSDDTLALLSAWALTQIAPKCEECAEQTVPVLIGGLEHPNAKHRRESAVALGSLGPLARAAVPALEQATDDANLGVRTAAAEALETIR